MNFIDIIDDILINEIFTRLTAKHIMILSLTCKHLNYFIYNKFKFLNPFSNRIKRLQEWEDDKPNSECSIVLDRMHYVHAGDNEHTIVIFVKIHIQEDYSLLGPPGIQYTNDGWKTVYFGHFQKYDNIWYVVFYEEEIEWFALQVVAVKSNKQKQNYEIIEDNIVRSWDNNHGWNYAISRKYHWIPDYVNMHIHKFKICCDHINQYSFPRIGSMGHYYLDFITDEQTWINGDICMD